VDLAVDAVRVLALSLTVLLPGLPIRKREIIPGGRQHMRNSLSPEFDGDTVKFESFFGRPSCGTGPPLIRCSRVPEQSAILYWVSHPIVPVWTKRPMAKTFVAL